MQINYVDVIFLLLVHVLLISRQPNLYSLPFKDAFGRSEVHVSPGVTLSAKTVEGGFEAFI